MKNALFLSGIIGDSRCDNTTIVALQKQCGFFSHSGEKNPHKYSIHRNE